MAFFGKADLEASKAAKRLIEAHVPSRMRAQDSTIFDFSEDAQASASSRMGWATLASNPPKDPATIAILAQQARCEGLDAVVLIGQGGSTQAPQTITKLHSLEVPDEIPFRTMDSISPVYVNHILGSSLPERTLYIVSSKSGSTLEPTVLSHVAWKYACGHIGAERASKRFVAITDPGSDLENVARKNGWRVIVNGEPNVGGRYSALSVFGLVPMACVGINVEQMLKDAIETEEACGSDSLNNPALKLAVFLYDNYCKGRNKFSLLMPSYAQVFGLWVEQLVAESLGKQGKGILPNVEVDPGILSDPHTDRCAILCNMGNSSAFEHAKECLNPSIPVHRLDILSVADMADHFLIWEYAIAFCGWLMEIDPFNQPDVESTKAAVKIILSDNNKRLDIPKDAFNRDAYASFELDDCDFADRVMISSAVIDAVESEGGDMSVERALRALFRSIEEGDYFSLNAFLPFRGVGRRETLERIRHRVADRLGACSCLEIGPRYLHSTGQLQKGGPNNGVFLVLSSEEAFDMTVPHTDYTLGTVAKAQAMGDFSELAARGRRAVYVNLRDNDSEYLQKLANATCSAISAAYATRVNN